MRLKLRQDRVYLRDASFYASSKASGKLPKYHWAREDGGTSQCGRAILLDDSGADPAHPRRTARCRAPGCRERWDRYIDPRSSTFDGSAAKPRRDTWHPVTLTRLRQDRVYLRDASVTDSGPWSYASTKYHFPGTDGSGLSACGRVILFDDSEEDPRDTLRSERCGAPGCRQRWEKALT